MLIPCPCCGPRDVSEFSYGGDAEPSRPAPDNEDPAAWYDYVFSRSNPMGPHEEVWQHVHGCRLFLKVKRDTLTHKIEGAALIGPWAGRMAEDEGA